MEVVKNSDIAQLVLGYLRDQNLEEAATVFCKTSHYLRDEYRLLKKGLRSMSLGSSTLMDIIKEHCQIKSIVAQAIEALPPEKHTIKQNSLLRKVAFLIKSKREKTSTKKEEINQISLKRVRSTDSVDNLEATRIQDLPGYNHFSKRRRMSNSFLYLTNPKFFNDSTEDNTLSSDTESSEKEVEISEDSSSVSDYVPEISTLSETILRRTEFQDVLLENINKAIKTSSTEKTDKVSTENKENPSAEISRIELDRMIESIIDDTEKDPTFNDIIYEAVQASNSTKKTQLNKSTRVQSVRQDDKSNKSENISSTNEKSCASTRYSHGTLEDQMSLSHNFVETEHLLPISTVLPPKQLLVSSSKLVPSTDTVEINENVGGTSYFDSNFSPKFIVLNSNETLGNDNVFTCANINNIQSFNGNDPVLIELGSNHFPYVVTNENIPFPILVNSNILQQETANAVVSNNEKVDNLESVPSEHSKNMNMDNVIFNPAEFQAEKGRKTPGGNKIKIPTMRSFSTPRRRASHVRVLNFGATPSKQQIEIVNYNEIGLQGAHLPLPSVGENITVETSVTSITSNNVHEIASDSNSIGFCAEQSNETVIQKEISETPRRKKNGKECIRNLSRSNSEEDFPIANRLKKVSENKDMINKDSKKQSLVVTKHISKKSEGERVNSKIDERNKDEQELLEKWNKMRTALSNPNWDQHLREMQSEVSTMNKKPKRSHKKKEEKCYEDKKINKIQKPSEKDIHQKDKIEDKEQKLSLIAKKSTDGSSKMKSSDPVLSSKLDARSSKFSIQKNLIKFKIPTTSKRTKNSSQDAQEKENEVNENHEPLKTLENNPELNEEVPAGPSGVDNSNNQFSTQSEKDQPSTSMGVISNAQIVNELIKRTENIGLLLETPFKTNDIQVPVTPGLMLPEIEETPITKMMKTLQFTTSTHKLYDIETPNFAITPGAGLTPLEKDTPNSGVYSNRPTDYSSSGSYYKPDESEDLDRHLDRLLFVERKKNLIINQKTQSENPNEDLSAGKNDDGKMVEQNDNISSEQHVNNISGNTEKLSTSELSTNISNRDQKSNLSLSDISDSDNEICKQNLPECSKPKSPVMQHENDQPNLEDLEQKRLRMKENLKRDFSKTKTKQYVRINKKERTGITIAPKRVITRTSLNVMRRRISADKKSHFENCGNGTSEDKMDVLTALNLSAKKVDPPKEPLNKKINEVLVENDNAVTKDLFEYEQFSKVRSEDDSRESAESLKVRNAAMALTTFQKNLASQIKSHKTEEIKERNVANNNSNPTRTETYTSTNHSVLLVRKTPNRFCKTIRMGPKELQRKRNIKPIKFNTKVMCLPTTSPKSKLKSCHDGQVQTQPIVQTRVLRGNKNTAQKNIQTVQPTPVNKQKTKNEKIEIKKTKSSEKCSPVFSRQPKLVLKKLTDEQLYKYSPTKSKFEKITEQKKLETQASTPVASNNCTEINLPQHQVEEIPPIEINTSKTDVSDNLNNQNSNQNQVSVANKSSNDDQSKESQNVLENRAEENRSEEKQNSKSDNESSEEEGEEEDPYDECEKITIDENDKTRFIQVCSNLDDCVPSRELSIDERVFEQTRVFYVNNSPHKIKICEEVELFSKNSALENQQKCEYLEQRRTIKNIPKKRGKKVIFLEYDNSSKELKQQSVLKRPSRIRSTDNVVENSEYDDEDEFHHTSPCKPRFRMHFANRFTKDPSIKKIPKKKIYVPSKRKTSRFTKKSKTRKSETIVNASINRNLPESTLSVSDDQAETLRQEDIYAVLSHLHGTDDVRF